MSDEIEELRTRIWITARCHMNAERRNRFLEIYFHLLLAFYSITAIGNSILGRESGAEVNSGILLYVSILTLSISLLIFGFKFGEVAAQHRSCYLMLQKIMSSSFEGDLNERYIDIIGNLPNHKQIDYLRLAIDNPLSKTQRLKLANGKNYEITKLQSLSYVVRRVSTWAFLVLLTVPACAVTYWNVRLFFNE